MQPVAVAIGFGVVVVIFVLLAFADWFNE